MKVVLVLAMTIGLVSARCPNDCSGHGSCSAGSVCNCRRNFAGNDCSQRICYEGLAFIDNPLGDINANNKVDIVLQSHYQHQNNLINEKYPANYGLARTDNKAEWNEAHFYAPCSNRGTCDSTTGQCACFPGFEGEGCVRTSCPNNCGAHGECVLIDNDADVHGETYDSWDAQKTQKCVCDAGYTGPNCNQKQCVMGVDPIENLYTNTDSVWKIEWKQLSTTGAKLPNGNVHFTISYSDDFGDVWTTSAITIEYNIASGKSTPTFMLGTPSTTDLSLDSFEPTYIAEQVNASIQALPNDVIRDSFVWAVQHDGTKLLHAYPYPNTALTSFKNTDLETAAGAVNSDKKKNTAGGKSLYVNDQKYRMPLWKANTAGAIATAYNCAKNSLCLFVKLNEPKGSKNMVVNYKFSAKSGTTKLEEQYGTDKSALGIVSVKEVGSDRVWSTALDGSPTIAFASTTKLHVCSKRGLCDYSTGTCKCFTGYSGHNCGKRNVLGLA